MGVAVVKRLALALALLTASAAFLGRGTWIFAKAQVAQVLLVRAWDETRDSGRAVKPWPWADTWPVARLRVPRLGVEEIVLAGGNGQAMAFGPGHLSRTAEPGQGGNVVLAGHRDTHFRFLRDLRPGDEILLEAAYGAPRRYRVTETAVVDFRDRRPLAASLEPTLTLITCYPFDVVIPGGPLRYIVRAAKAQA
jgi:sortase A